MSKSNTHWYSRLSLSERKVKFQITTVQVQYIQRMSSQCKIPDRYMLHIIQKYNY